MSDDADLTPIKARKTSQNDSFHQESAKKEKINRSFKKPESRGSCSTPGKQGHRRVNSQNINEVSLNYSRLSNSRLDFASVPDINVDILACCSDIKRYQIEGLRQSLAEKKLMDEEWSKAKKNMKKEQEKNCFLDEEFLTKSRVDMKKWCLEKEKERNNLETNEKIKEFYIFKEAKKELKIREKRRDQEYLRNEKAKSVTRNTIENDRKALLKSERDEKRRAFIESKAAAKNMEELEKIRLKKEREFQYAQEVAGKRRMMYQNYENKKNSLEKVLLIVNN